MTETIEANHYPEVADDGKAMRRVELLGLKETFVDSAERRGYFC